MNPFVRPVVRVKDIAVAANVSTAAVSRYLNGKLALSPTTAGKVDSAVARLGYIPNQNARRLRRGTTEILGLIIPDIANPFFSRLADAVQQAAEAEGYELLINTTRNRAGRERECLVQMNRGRADGVLFVTNHADDGTLARAITDGGAAVLLDEDVPGATAPRLFADNEAGGRMAAQHLIDRGHRRLGILSGPPGLLSTVERHGGFHAAVAAANAGGIHCAVVFEDFSDYTALASRAAAVSMFDAAEPPTAVFATSDETALGLLEAARHRGIRIPESLSVVTFDDIGPLHLLNPPLTAIRQPVEEMASGGVRLLLASIRGEVPALFRRLPVELIQRASVAPPPAARHKDH